MSNAATDDGDRRKERAVWLTDRELSCLEGLNDQVTQLRSGAVLNSYLTSLLALPSVA